MSLRVLDADLAACHPGAGWQLRHGMYRVEVGRSSADLRLHADYIPTATAAKFGIQLPGQYLQDRDTDYEL